MQPKTHVRDGLVTTSQWAFALLLLAAAGVADAKSYLVIARSEQLPSGLKAAVEAAGGVLVRTIPAIGVAVAESSAPDFAARLVQGAPDVRSVVSDPRLPWINPGLADATTPLATASDATDDPLSVYQWGLDAIEAFAAHQAGATGRGVVVAVVDTGIDYTHPDLAANYLGGYDFANMDNDPYDDYGHGTHVAGIIAAARNDVGIVGVAPEAMLLAVKVLDEHGWGTISSMLGGIVYAAGQRADVINMSLGIPGGLPRRGFSDYYGAWISGREVAEIIVASNRATGYAHKMGTTVVVSAGNKGIDMDHSTNLFAFAQTNYVIAVSATAPEMWVLYPDTDLDVPACYTNYGQSTIHVAAPGGDYDMMGECDGWWFDMVLSTVPEWFGTDGYDWMCGTSMAAPHVAGVAALIIARNGGSMHPDQVKVALQGSADDLGRPGRDDYYGYGRVNARRAVRR